MDNNENSKNLTSCYLCSFCSFCSSCYDCSFCFYCSSCYFSKGLRMSENMIFCLGEGTAEKQGYGYQKNNMIFNQQVTESEFEKIKNSLPEIALPLMDYEEAWAKWWSEAKTEDKEKILSIPQFDGKIFTEITGIKDFKSKSLKGKKVKVELDGQSYEAIIKSLLLEQRQRMVDILNQTSARFCKSPVVEMPEMLRLEEFVQAVEKEIAALNIVLGEEEV